MNEPKELTTKQFNEVKRAAKDAGYGTGPDEYEAYPEIVVTEHGSMPGWMAEVFARLPLTDEEEG